MTIIDANTSAAPMAVNMVNISFPRKIPKKTPKTVSNRRMYAVFVALTDFIPM